VTLKFVGNFKKLKRSVALTEIDGAWWKLANHYQYRAKTGAVLNWWKSTKTITFQGRESAAKKLKAEFLDVATVTEKNQSTPWRRC